MNDVAAEELIKELAVEHGVALDRGDPLLVLQTATIRILRLAIAEAQEQQADGLKRHGEQLEDVLSRWQEDAALVASRAAEAVASRTEARVARAAEAADRTVGKAIDRAIGRHEQALTRFSWTCALCAALSVAAASVALLH